MPAIPVALIAERRLVGRLLRANAMSPEKAVALDDLSFIMSRRLTRLVDTGVIRKAGPGYYLSAPDFADHEEARRHRVLYVVLLLVVVFLALAVWIPNHRQ